MASEAVNVWSRTSLILIMLSAAILVVAVGAVMNSGLVESLQVPLWEKWVILVFLFALIIGIIGPLSGVGGGVIFVGLGMAILPFNVDFIRGAGLVAALSTSLNSAPYFTKKGLANLRIVAPLVSVSTIFSVFGGVIGLWISNSFPEGSYYVKMSLGVVLLVLLLILSRSKNVEYPPPREKKDRLSEMIDLTGGWYEPTLNRIVTYEASNLPLAMLAFSGVGFLAGMFGLGAGWANVPILNLVMGLPLKAAVASSMLILAINDSASLWVYLANGAVLPIVVVPVVLGISIGSRIGSRLAAKTKPKVIKRLVIALIALSGVVNIIQGLSGIGLLNL
ncbi:conserved hypothetical protein [Archaeoglobus fulgidus DSM 4304]|uniref:Probable membrane transporter protein n=3 Tax=Archaeoglobus fulgidus TaxID=2234 RepID=O28641_ARCFU|nr:sulfite exporter TauE/SafE family protein [Archaeoglobus fulgidus]AAB89606.1 conserved hypothetical protein [Archaeoglobus fulgidus DSM 4304]AIG98636.1 putative permease [Archaeoglobus fulgidus DSM 8774]KUJ93025.1 MAG: hypothetical protein XD40_1793 [Archaeoglobus fulgidus]KUK05445.1 MAG: hypothetical protein XD48_2318 [Archaeoglobus fulgidus]